MDFLIFMYFAGWILSIGLIVAGIKFLFASDETLLRNADKFFTNNPLIARAVCVVFLIAGVAGCLVMFSFEWPL